MYLLKAATPLFSNFQLLMLILLAASVVGIFVSHAINRRADKIEYRRRAQQRLIEPMDSAVSSRSTTVFKN